MRTSLRRSAVWLRSLGGATARPCVDQYCVFWGEWAITTQFFTYMLEGVTAMPRGLHDRFCDTFQVYFSTRYLKNYAPRFTKLDIGLEMFHHESWKPTYFWSKVKIMIEAQKHYQHVSWSCWFRLVLILVSFAHVSQWSTHSGSALYAVKRDPLQEPRFKPGSTSAFHQRIISNNSYAHDEQGDNPGQEKGGSIFSKRQRITLRLLYAISRPSVVCCLSVCL